jgi:predicted DNA-binding transcriptional regulator AlpA|tara:strand:- start:8675 stop:8863 length:189 start_codon:yes stop_codon:yes gene_type:complete
MEHHAMPNTQFLTNDEFCQLLRCSDTTLWRMRQIPGFPQPRRFGRRLLWSREQLEQILNSTV